MTMRQDSALLLATAKAVAGRLKERIHGTRLRIRTPSQTQVTKTDGWRAVIGDLGSGQPRLEIWLDRFTGYPDRKLQACFFSKVRQPITAITRRVDRKLWPVRVVTPDDTGDEDDLVLVKRLARQEFNAPVLEKYAKENFYGIYDPTRLTSQRVNPHFVVRAVAFFEDVARALPRSTAADEQREVFPQYENRKRVTSHLQRERSGLLAAECKIRDRYRCQVCGFRFEDRYGELGSRFAEAHHLVPLGTLRGQVRTRLEDLISVCANCHRMLHRMAGHRTDKARLKAIVARHRRRRA
jgi:5-methylcytosine-specific restriction endonuclease McrA